MSGPLLNITFADCADMLGGVGLDKLTPDVGPL